MLQNTDVEPLTATHYEEKYFSTIQEVYSMIRTTTWNNIMQCFVHPLLATK